MNGPQHYTDAETAARLADQLQAQLAAGGLTDKEIAALQNRIATVLNEGLLHAHLAEAAASALLVLATHDDPGVEAALAKWRDVGVW